MSAKIPVTVVADGITEGSETFTVTLSAPTGGATLGRAVGTATIVDDDPALPLTLGIGSASVIEGQAGTAPMSVVVTLSQPSATTVTVLVNSSNGTATSGADYTAVVNKLVTIPPGALSASVTVTVKSDLLVEPDETLALTLSAPTGGAVIGRATGTDVILNDD